MLYSTDINIEEHITFDAAHYARISEFLLAA